MQLLANNMIRKYSFQNIIVDFTFLLSRKGSQFHLVGIMFFLKLKCPLKHQRINSLKIHEGRIFCREIFFREHLLWCVH